MLGERFELYIDYKFIRYLFSQKELYIRQQRLLECLTTYYFGIKYTPRKRNKVSDALSRKHRNVVLAILAE